MPNSNFERMKNSANLPTIKEEVFVEQKPVNQPKKTCNNCFIDPITKKSMGVYNKRGPEPFTKICPICKGEGKA